MGNRGLPVVALAAALALSLLSSCSLPEPGLHPNHITDSICFGPVDDIFSMTLSPDGENIYVYRHKYLEGDRLTVLRASDHQPLRHIDYGYPPWGMMVTPDNRYLYVGEDPELADPAARVWVMDLSNDSIVASVEVLRDPAPLAITPDSRFVYVTGWPDWGLVFDTDGHRVVDTLRDVWLCRTGAVSPDGRLLYMTGTRLRVLDTETNTVVDTALPGAQVFSLALLPDGSRLYVSAQTDTSMLYVLSLPDLTVEDSIKTAGQLGQLAALPDGDFVYALGSGVVYAIRTEDNAFTDTIPHDLLGPALFVHPSGDRVYLGPASWYFSHTSKILVIGY